MSGHLTKSPTLLLVLAATLGASGCRTAKGEADLVESNRVAMGSQLRIAVWTADRETATRAIGDAFAEFERIEAALSVWRDGSDVQRLNAAAGVGPVAVGTDTRVVLRAAAEASRLTHGAFDITFGALSDVWRFDHDQDNRIPAPDEIADRLPLIDYAAVVVDETAGTAEIRRAGVRVHLGGIGKGYAVDRAVAILRDAGFADFLIQAGGDLYAGGRRGDRPWRVGLQDPRGDANEHFATIDLEDETFSTSGDYERFFIESGVRYHHLLDPRTGQPARGCRSVTILARSALVADWLSTGVFILGPEEGLALVESLPEAEAVIVTAGNEVRVSNGLRDRLTVEREPKP
ncbi:MAG: FAD:protein FMN transferase [Acidobacteriota bacterium]|nr:FAD:protein FMN transferase [Acidobacteriota bacterium]